MDAQVADIFGYYAVQLGLPRMPALRMNRMHSRILARREADGDVWPESGGGLWTGHPAGDHTPHEGGAAGCKGLGPDDDDGSDVGLITPEDSGEALAVDARTRAAPGAVDGGETEGPAPAWTHRLEVADFEDLPFADQSLDLIVLPHVLEFSPDPHRVLREVDRTLRPDGRVLVTGFNPVSLWGARQWMPRALARPFLPPSAHFIGAPRLRDWFKLLSFEPARAQFGCYRPAIRSQVWLDRTRWFEGLGDRCWPICGGVYCLAATKRVRAIRMVGPAWPARTAKRARVAVVASSQRQHRDRGA